MSTLRFSAAHRRVLARLIIAGVFVFCPALTKSTAIADEDSAAMMDGQTTQDPSIPTDYLKVILRPLTKDELQTELNAWVDLLKDKITSVGETELQIKSLGENEPGEALTKQLGDQRFEEIALIERIRIITKALTAKGGNAEDAEQFIDAVSGVGETTDAISFRATLVAQVTNWACERTEAYSG